MDAYGRRRHRELTQLGSIVAAAFHEPNRLGELKPPPTSTPLQPQLGWWEQPPTPA